MIFGFGLIGLQVSDISYKINPVIQILELIFKNHYVDKTILTYRIERSQLSIEDDRTDSN